MSDQTTLTAALVGGALALSGTIISQIFGLLSGRFQRRHERDLRQRQRLEQLTDAVGASLPWIQTLHKCQTLEELVLVMPPPEARRAAMLAKLYFPSLVTPATEFANSLVRYHRLAIDCFRFGHPGSVGAQMESVSRDDPKLRAIYNEGLNLRIRLDEAIAKEAKKYTHT